MVPSPRQRENRTTACVSNVALPRPTLRWRADETRRSKNGRGICTDPGKVEGVRAKGTRRRYELFRQSQPEEEEKVQEFTARARRGPVTGRQQG